MKINFYRSGSHIEIDNDSIDLAAVNKNVNDLLKGTSEILRVYIDEEGLKEIKSSETSVEIIFDEVYQVSSKEIGDISVKKILLPFTGDYGLNRENGEVIIFTGEDEYISTPLLNPSGVTLIEQLQKNLHIFNTD